MWGEEMGCMYVPVSNLLESHAVKKIYEIDERGGCGAQRGTLVPTYIPTCSQACWQMVSPEHFALSSSKIGAYHLHATLSPQLR